MKAKRYLAILLAIAMVFGAVSMASAASVAGSQFSDIGDASQKDSIGLLGALGIVQGHGGTNNYAPADNLTRAEFGVMMSRLIDQEEAAKVMAALASNFTDADSIPDWALGYVNFAAANGWLKGFPDGSVQAGGTLTLAQSVTVVLRVLGYGNTVPDSAYPAGHLAKGAQLGLTRGVPVGGSDTPITRDDMARIVANALFVPQMGDDGKVGDSIVAGQVIKGKVSKANSSEITINVKDPADNGEDETTRKFADSVTIVGNAGSLGGLVGLTVEAFTADAADDSEKVFLVRVSTGDVEGIKGAFDEFDEDRSGDDTKYLIVLKDGTKVEYTDDTQYSVNGRSLAKNPFSNLKEHDEVHIHTAGGVATTVYATRWTSTNRLFSSVDKQDVTLVAKDDNANVFKTTGGTSITLNGEAAKLSDLKKNDVIDVVVKGRAPVYSDVDPYVQLDEGTAEALAIRATRTVLEGTVTENVAGTNINITVRLADGTTKTVKALWTDAKDIAPGQKVKFALNAAGDAVTDLGHGLGGNYAKLLSVSTRATDAGQRKVAIFNVGGEDVSYYVAGHVPQLTIDGWDIDTVGRLRIDVAGQLVSFTELPDPYEDGEVYSVSGDALIVKLDSNSSYHVISADGALYAGTSAGAPGKALKASDFPVGTKVLVAFGTDEVDDAIPGPPGTNPNAPDLPDDQANVAVVLKKHDGTTVGGPGGETDDEGDFVITLSNTKFQEGYTGQLRVSFDGTEAGMDSSEEYTISIEIRDRRGDLAADYLDLEFDGDEDPVRFAFAARALEHLAPGTYTVKVTVTDNADATLTKTSGAKTLTVTAK